MIYLDHHAASPPLPSVLEEMARARAVAWANPASAHGPGRAARAVVERARDQVAAAIAARTADVVFTAGGTEACNLAVLGLPGRAARVVTTDVEHPAMEAAVDELAARGAEVVRLPSRDLAEWPTDRLDRALEGAGLVVVQLVNHETGAVLPVAAVGARCRAHGIPLVVDATQALAKVPVDVTALSATAVALASSKIGGPPAAGALWITRDAALSPRALGGGQERGRRAGSPDPIALAGFGLAASLVAERLGAMPQVAARRDRLERALVDLGAVVNGASLRVATVTNVSVPGWRGPSLVAALDLEGLCVSHGAACSSGIDEPSRVVAAGWPDEPWRAESALRLSLAPSTTDAEVDGAISILRRVISRKRA